MNQSLENRFQVFFEDEKYIALKNSLYNYLLRKRAVEKVMRKEKKGLVLEVGSGISPVLTSCDQVVYSDLSFSALRTLKQMHGKGYYVVANGMCLPFKADAFSHVISSEVLEHLEDDRGALQEFARVAKPSGNLIVTFPHRRFYFAYDDRFVNHHRRYELPGMVQRLGEVGFLPVLVRKVLGPLEKVIMCAAVLCFSLLQKVQAKRPDSLRLNASEYLIVFLPLFKWINRIFAVIAWIDANIMPRALSTVLLIKAVKTDNTKLFRSH